MTDHLRLGPLAVPVLYLDILLMLALASDAAIRYSNYLREHEWIGGFLEWLVPQWLRNPGARTRTRKRLSARHSLLLDLFPCR